MKKVEIYSTPTCTYCTLAKDYFTKNGVEYVEYNVAADQDKRKEMVDLTGQLGVPVIVIDGNAMVGFDELALKNALA